MALSIIPALDGISSTLAAHKSARFLSGAGYHNFSSSLLYVLSKYPISLFILRIKRMGWLKWALYALMAGLVAITVPYLVILLAQCQLVKAFWSQAEGECWDPHVYANAIWAQVREYSMLHIGRHY